MNDLISRQDVLDYIDSMPSELTNDGRRMIRRVRLTEYIADTLPSAQPERKKGKWVKTIKHYKDDNMEFDFYAIKCSACGEKPEKAYHLTRYCPNCGAEMRKAGDVE